MAGVDLMPDLTHVQTGLQPNCKFRLGEDITNEMSLQLYRGYDLVLLKDVLQHMPDDCIRAVLARLMDQRNKHILIVNSRNQKMEPRELDKDFISHPLKHTKAPLNEYNPRLLFNFKGKEAIVIDCWRLPLEFRKK